jgi:serine/threonine-protein kinase PknG
LNCTQAGCSGELVDGYCNICGMAPRGVAGGAAVVARPPAADSETAGAGSSVSRRATTGGSRRSTSRLGAGLVEFEWVPYRDPSSVVMDEPAVAESRRFCGRCREPVGRGRDGQPGLLDGFCRRCGAPFSFAPQLAAGELLAGQYEVAGCLAHGGMGWIYLARDRNVSDRWVVLKGLLNAGDDDATAAALAERRFLAEVEHPNIVKILNFVQHHGAGYIVMEYVGGKSLKQILADRRDANGGRPDPLPPAQAIAYILEILPALGYLHRSGLLFCDFKLDNVIQTQHSLKLIDLGGVYRMDDRSSPVYGTVGYQAPEVADTGPTVASDLFTVARTLALLCIDFKGYQSTFMFTLPPQDVVPLFERHDSLYRLLLRGTTGNLDDRFQSADEMSEQLLGVLREVVAADTGMPVPGPSRLFTAGFRASPDRADWRTLPALQVVPDDPAAGYLATLAAAEPEQLADMLRAAPERTREVRLRLARALIEAGELAEADELIDEIERDDPWEWRAAWSRGIGQLARGAPVAAGVSFNAVYRALPGELAPKLALGEAAELAGEHARACAWYEVVSRTDPSYTSASFGLARCLLAGGDTAGALAAYDRVPEASSAYVDAQVAKIRCLLATDRGHRPGLDELSAASAGIETLPLDPEQRARLGVELLSRALESLGEGRAGDAAEAPLLGWRLEARDLRLGLESGYRTLARLAATGDERIRLVDAANAARPRTWT